MADIPNRLQVATEPTQLEIKTNVENVNTNVTSVKNDVAIVKTNVATVNTNVNTLNTNVGTPTSTASNGTSANVHAKLNWMISNESTMNSKVLTKPVLKVTGTESSYSSSILRSTNGTLRPYTGSANLYLSVTGSGRLLYVLNSTENYACLINIDGKGFALTDEGVFDIPFSTSLRIEYGGSSPSYAPRLIYYELNM